MYQNPLKNKKVIDVYIVDNLKQWTAAIFRLRDVTQPKLKMQKLNKNTVQFVLKMGILLAFQN